MSRKLKGFRDFLVKRYENSTSLFTDDWGLEPLVDVHELASYMGILIPTVYDWPVDGKGPAYRFGKHLKFAISDVRAWISHQRAHELVAGQPVQRPGDLLAGGHRSGRPGLPGHSEPVRARQAHARLTGVRPFDVAGDRGGTVRQVHQAVGQAVLQSRQTGPGRAALRPGAVRHEVLPRNPMDHVARLHREPHIPAALMAPEANVIRVTIAQRESAADHISGPKPDGKIGSMIEVMLGASA
ncbi:helix-turn-helix domain-containing protein [Cryobacterium sp. PAMC25264]|nr:helix-turn-helix domain-containing protein [Cryobacterium sp. PAMC25264]